VVPRCHGLPGFAEIHGDVGVEGQLGVFGHFLAAVPCERAAQMGR
jgi:hypothetical protein